MDRLFVYISQSIFVRVSLLLLILLQAGFSENQKNKKERNNEIRELIKKGFLQARVESDKIMTGPIFKVEEVVVSGAADGIVREFNFNPFFGEPASKTTTDQIVLHVKNWLINNGFLFYQIEVDILPTKGFKQRVTVHLNLETGPGFRLGELQHQGSKVDGKVLMKLGLLKKGEIFNPDRLEKARNKLARTGYFYSVQEGNLFKDSIKLYLYPSVLLEDVKGNNITGILGYNSEDDASGRLSGFMDIELFNIRGTARDLEIHFSSRDKKRDFQFKYDEPWILNSPLGAGFDFFFLEEDSVYEQAEIGFRLFHEYDFHSKYIITYTSESNTEKTFYSDTSISKSSDAIHTGLDWIFDWRETVPLTFSGYLFELGTKGIRRNESDSVRFLFQNSANFEIWSRIFQSKWIIHIKSYNRGIYPFVSSLENRGDLFYTGGAHSFRGYLEKEFLTNFTFFQNYEILYQISPRNRVLAFFDPGWVNKRKKIFDGNWKYGYGVGLDLGSKAWVFGINYALNPDRGIGNGLLHVKVTNKF